MKVLSFQWHIPRFCSYPCFPFSLTTSSPPDYPLLLLSNHIQNLTISQLLSVIWPNPDHLCAQISAMLPYLTSDCHPFPVPHQESIHHPAVKGMCKPDHSSSTQKSHCVTQAGLKFLGSSHLPASVSYVAGTHRYELLHMASKIL